MDHFLGDKMVCFFAKNYDRRLTEVEKLRRQTNVLVERLQEAESRNNKLMKVKKAKTEEIMQLERKLAESEKKNKQLTEKLISFEENELLDSE